MHEQRAIYIAMLIIGLPVVVIAGMSGEPIGGTVTLAGMVSIGGVVGLIAERQISAKWAIPRAVSVTDPAASRRGRVASWVIVEPPPGRQRARTSSRLRRSPRQPR